MGISVAKQSYGKSQVCLSFIDRGNEQHNFTQLVADISLEGDFDAAYIEGDNSKVVPTDTMKNSVYAMAREHGIDSLETFGRQLSNHFYESFEQISVASVALSQLLWNRMDLDGEKHGHAFTGGGSEKNTVTSISSAAGVKLRSGLSGLQVLKTSGSGFEGFHKDKFTTLKETSDRIFATTISANWPCRDVHYDWTKTRGTIRNLLLDVFAHQYSPSVQKTLYDMAQSVLAACSQIDEISLDMPNQHHLLVDMQRLNLENQNDIFLPSPEPFGVISGTVKRD